MALITVGCLVIKNKLTGPGKLDKIQKLDPSFNLPQRGDLSIRCSQIEMSDTIPNIFDGFPFGVPFDNSRLRVATDVHTWYTVQLPMGLYLDGTVLSAAINSAINTQGWWTNPVDPGLVISGNSAIEKFSILLDSSKLNPIHGTQFMVDFSEAPTSSKFYQLIGVTNTTSYIADGLYTSTVLPEMETQGTANIVELDLAPPVRYDNEDRRIIASVSFAGKYTGSNTIYPQGNMIPEPRAYPGPRTIKSYEMNIKTRAGLPMIFMGGIIEMWISFVSR